MATGAAAGCCGAAEARGGARSSERGVECDDRLRLLGRGGIANAGRDGDGSRREWRLRPGRAITGRVGGRAWFKDDEVDGEVDSRVGVLVRALLLARAFARSSEYLFASTIHIRVHIYIYI